MATRRAAAGFGLDLDEYLDYRGRARPEQTLWENNGWSLRGTAGDREVLIWASPYLLKGAPGRPFRIDRAAVCQSMLIAVDGAAKARGLHDNKFMAVGWDVDEFLPWDACAVASADGRNVWEIGGRRFESAPPRWRIRGAHAGLDLDVDLAAIGDCFWLTPPEQPFGEREDRWFVAYAEASGTVDWEGRPRVFRGHACHERHIHLGASYDPVRLLRDGGVTWHNGFSDDLQYMLLARPSLNRYWGRVMLEGRVLEFTRPGQVEIAVEQTWVDPRGGFSVPSRWHLVMRGRSGTLDVRCAAFARAYYLWNYYANGATVLYWWLCESEGRFTFADGRALPLAGLRSDVHRNRTFYAATGPLRPGRDAPWRAGTPAPRSEGRDS